MSLEPHASLGNPTAPPFSAYAAGVYLQQPPPVVIDLAQGVVTKSAAAILVCAGLGSMGFWSGLTGHVAGGDGVAAAAVVIGSVLLLIALAGCLLWKVITRPRSLVIEQAGVRWIDRHADSWEVAWPELAAIAVSRTVNRNPRKLVPSAMVRLDLFPADHEFRQRHPEMEQLWEFHRVCDGYRLPFGDIPDSHALVPRLDEGLRRFAGPRYRGVCDEGFTVGLF